MAGAEGGGNYEKYIHGVSKIKPVFSSNGLHASELDFCQMISNINRRFLANF